MKIRQIDITEALDLAKKDVDIYVISNPGKPVIKSFNTMTVGNVLSENSNFIFFVLEES